MARYGEAEKVVFTAASVGVRMDPNARTQTFFDMHDEDIISLDIHPNKKIAATGQMAAKGKTKVVEIYVWDIATKSVLACLKGFHLRAVGVLAFSPNGKYLLSVGRDNDNSLAIYDWANNNRIVATSKVDKSKVTCGVWKSNSQFVTCGLKHIKFW